MRFRTLNGSPNGTVDTEPSTFDPLSIIFKFREMDLEQPGILQCSVRWQGHLSRKGDSGWQG